MREIDAGTEQLFCTVRGGGDVKDNLNDAPTQDHLTSPDGEALRPVETSRLEDRRGAVNALKEKRTPVFGGR